MVSSFTFSVTSILAAFSFIADLGNEGVSAWPLVRRAEVLVLKVDSNSFQHALISEFIG